MNSVQAVTFSIVSAAGFVYCFFTMVQFAVFLYKSGQRPVRKDDECRESSWVSSLVINLALLLLFIFQHTLMASYWWKHQLKVYGLTILSRSLYVIATSLSLQVLFHWWQPVFPCNSLWQFDIPSGSLASFVIFLVHCVSWLLVLAVCFTIDYAELMGVKQVYYSILGLPPPLHHKSQEHQRLFQHFRHPFSSGFLFVLWFVPVMRWDRFILSLGLSLYLFLGHSLDEDDYDYLREQYHLKEQQLWQSAF